MIVGVCKETQENEKRVALTPEGAEKLISLGLEVLIEKDAGVASSYTDEQYKEAGASIESERGTILKKSELFLAVQAPDEETIKKLKEGTVLVSFIWPLQNGEYVELLKKQGLRAMAMDTIPRISRAQSMDALSSMSNIAGYKAAL
ncbi:MAG: NAD(P)(+) transhydrogenase (Re/Si-specific) subunit alpha, partial [Balneolaceae bacterium]|nr:NAD(P)(+) transhydrogenase (Re/Si-specific) subunit alpha [Balneolaceae bacterium]